jgi:uncharacterized membrane protein
MQPSSMHYFPLAFPFVLALLFLLAVLIVLVELRVLSYAYEKLGLNQRYVFSLLLLSLLGSYVQHRPATIIAVNVGGAVIPTLLSLFLLVKNRLFVLGPLAVVIMAAAVYPMAHPVKGVGIAMPVLIPPLLAAGIALILSRKNAASLAYAAGSLGTLIGADLLHLGSIQGLGAPIASIGGAGTFDGIFLTGILAVLLA